MAEWQTVAEGVSFSDLKQLVADMELPKGTRVRVVMDTWADWAFDVAGAEWVFQPFVPEGLKIIDVYGENRQGVVDMEANSPWLVAVLAFIKAHWLVITIAGLILWAIVSFIRVMVQLPAPAQIPVWLILGAGIGIVALIALQSRGRSP